MPIVPPVARTACVLGKKPRSRWYPANLLLEVVGGGAGQARGKQIVEALGSHLAVDDKDDLFARFVARALDAAMPAPASSPSTPPFASLEPGDDQLHGFRGSVPATENLSPAERFCNDLGSVLELKPKLTRRQWTVLVEAALRLGLGMHTLWVCQLNVLAWKLVVDVASGKAVPPEAELESLLWTSHCGEHPLLEIGQNSEPMLKQLVERYAYARFGLNLLLC